MNTITFTQCERNKHGDCPGVCGVYKCDCACHIKTVEPKESNYAQALLKAGEHFEEWKRGGIDKPIPCPSCAEKDRRIAELEEQLATARRKRVVPQTLKNTP